jgi:hypothetical protein
VLLLVANSEFMVKVLSEANGGRFLLFHDSLIITLWLAFDTQYRSIFKILFLVDGINKS